MKLQACRTSQTVWVRTAGLLFAFGWRLLTPVLGDESGDLLFENQIRPVLVETCFRCHGDSKTSGGLRVDSRESILKGGDSGPAIVPGNPADSLLIHAIGRREDVSAMPPDRDKSLRPDQVAAFETWIRTGAVWPAASGVFRATTHWAFEPVRDVVPPVTNNADWGLNTVDALIRSKQEVNDLTRLPATPADKRTLIRRATFDLTGLPAAPQDVSAFEADDSVDAFDRVVDRLLASPHYGERWGRHWLDVVRYADTAGETADYPVPQAWRYRNYVIDSFNADKPYDKFLQEQIAGDVLALQGPAERYAEQVTATGYLAISRRFGFDSENYHHLTIQDTIDTLGQSVLGLSLGCARCHDHKFDAVSMTDYYGLYGIFDSSRYAFPGSEQKQKFRAMVPLLPPLQSRPQWRDFQRQAATLAGRLEKHNQPVPTAVLRSLNEMDGDFELQAPAAGGSNGVLVPPWLYEGKIAVTSAAQSPFRNVYSGGRVGVSLSADVGQYRIAQSVYPKRTKRDCENLYVNIDFRVAPTSSDESGVHRFWVGSLHNSPTATVLISADAVALQQGDLRTEIAKVTPHEWQNLRLHFNLSARTVSGSVGNSSSTVSFSDHPMSPDSAAVIDVVVLENSDASGAGLPAVEIDNIAIEEKPIPDVLASLPTEIETARDSEFETLTQQLRELAETDGSFELQTNASAPSTPWNPGPNSVVQVSSNAQSPFRNLYPAGGLGIHMPNRAEYDGFGLTLPTVLKADEIPVVSAGFDFRCADAAAGGDGSWRYYVGHGPGNSAAVELFFNGRQFFRRSAESTEPVCSLIVGQWYQVQLSLNLRDRSYVGTLTSNTSRSEFSGLLASGWDGMIDYSFIDSYGHIGGVRPALDADNYVVREQSLPGFTDSNDSENVVDIAPRRLQIQQIRQRLAALERDRQTDAMRLNELLVEGPFAMTYGMSEGTPHDVRLQLRGEPDRPGDVVPRGFIGVLGGGPLPRETSGSGRLELAHWLTRPENPLTARVMVNRIWQYHFGRGLVKTPNDFGVRGLPPTHPELLDHLAAQFVRSGWSVKAMHRLIMLSATYRQSSTPGRMPSAGDSASPRDALRQRPAAEAVVAEDLYTHFPRRRLSAEEIRDSILLITGELDSEPATAHPFPSPLSWGFSQHAPFSAVYEHNKRSVYLMTQRLKRHPFLALFDGADPNATTAQRLVTTVPTQSLFFLNDSFVHSKADAWSVRLLSKFSSEADQIDHVFRTALARSATAEEQQTALSFLKSYRAELSQGGYDDIERRALAAFVRTVIGSNEFLHVD